MCFSYSRLWNVSNVWIRVNKKDKTKDQYYKIKAIVISATVKDGIIKLNDKFFNLKSDRFLEKLIELDNLKKREIDLINYLIIFLIN